jgi:3-oxoacyl-[acyl-carrier-protein] synthase II
MADRRRVVVTGMGAVNALGLNAAEFAAGLREGRPGGGPITLFDPAASPVKIACEATGFDPTTVLDRKTARRTDRYTHFAVAAAREAVADAGLEIEPDAERIGASIATGIGGLNTLFEAHKHLFERGMERFSPFWVPALIPNMGAAYVSMELGTRGPLAASCTACAASSMAIGDALGYIRDGRADVMLAGGAEAAVTPMGVGGFHGMRALSQRNDDPGGASRPFDAGRDGLVIGEGGAVIVLEELGRAQARGARIMAEVTGYGLSSDALHVSEPDPTGANPARAIRMALDDAGRAPADVDYVNAHGTSTPVGDAAETRVLKLVFGEELAHRVPVSSTKSMTGHMLGAAGATEAVIAVIAMRDGFLPPTINLHDPDPLCDLDYVPNVARDAEVDVVISNGFGFGGHNACVVLERFRP